MTLEQIRAALPTHIPLTPGVHRWREGDELFISIEGDWLEVDEDSANGRYYNCPRRRPIPPHILDNQAFWLFAAYLESKGEKQQVNKLGGIEVARVKILEGRLYDKWLLEQMEVV